MLLPIKLHKLILLVMLFNKPNKILLRRGKEIPLKSRIKDSQKDPLCLCLLPRAKTRIRNREKTRIKNQAKKKDPQRKLRQLNQKI